MGLLKEAIRLGLTPKHDICGQSGESDQNDISFKKDLDDGDKQAVRRRTPR
jgi:hypothetical protein